MKGDIRRSIVFLTTIFVHLNDICIVGFCKPRSQQDQLVLTNPASLVFTIALALAILEADLCPRLHKLFRMQTYLIFIIELLISLFINNMTLRFLWLPLVSSGISNLHCSLSVMLLQIADHIPPCCTNHLLNRYACWMCSTHGVDTIALVVAFNILAWVVYHMYGKRIKHVYYAAMSHASEPRGPPAKRGSRVSPLRAHTALAPPLCLWTFFDSGDETGNAPRRSPRIQVRVGQGTSRIEGTPNVN